MKKIFIVFVMFITCSLFADDLIIKTGDSFNVFMAGEVKKQFACINEISPSDNGICKIVVDSLVIYLRKGDILSLEYYIQDGDIVAKDDNLLEQEKSINSVRVRRGDKPKYSTDRIFTKAKITAFDYNKIATEIVD